MNDLDAALAVNAEFYRAFRERDADAMDDLWARHTAVACVHPGWPPLTGRDEVMTSWRGIFANASAPSVECLSPEAFLCGDSIFVICFEKVEDAMLVATNIFVREDGVWRMVHHQAGPTAEATEQPRQLPPGTIH